MQIIRILLKIFGIYFILHSFRNLLQYLGIKNFFTEIGHKFGIKEANFLLKPLGLEYKIEYEIYFFIIELLIGALLIYLSKK